MAELIKQLDQQMEASASARLDPLRSALGLKFRHDYAPVSRHYVSSASFAQIISLWDQQSIKHADDMERRVGRCWINNPVPYGGECFEPYDMPDPKCSAIDPADLWAEDVGVPASLPAGVVPDIVERVAQDQARRLGVEAGALQPPF